MGTSSYPAPGGLTEKSHRGDYYLGRRAGSVCCLTGGVRIGCWRDGERAATGGRTEGRGFPVIRDPPVLLGGGAGGGGENLIGDMPLSLDAGKDFSGLDGCRVGDRVGLSLIPCRWLWLPARWWPFPFSSFVVPSPAPVPFFAAASLLGRAVPPLVIP